MEARYAERHARIRAILYGPPQGAEGPTEADAERE
jgi:hypothetical protein